MCLRYTLDYRIINAIFETCDVPVDWVPVDWIEVASHITPTSDDFDCNTWNYLHKKAVGVLDGDIDTYLQIIRDVNPYDDLLEYAESFEFGTECADHMEVEFTIHTDCFRNTVKGDMLDDYIAAISIRTIRDTFALLPVETVTVHALYSGKEVTELTATRSSFAETVFEGQDPSDIATALK